MEADQWWQPSFIGAELLAVFTFRKMWPEFKTNTQATVTSTLPEPIFREGEYL